MVGYYDFVPLRIFLEKLRWFITPIVQALSLIGGVAEPYLLGGGRLKSVFPLISYVVFSLTAGSSSKTTDSAKEAKSFRDLRWWVTRHFKDQLVQHQWFKGPICKRNLNISTRSRFLLNHDRRENTAIKLCCRFSWRHMWNCRRAWWKPLKHV